ncbi:MAG: putative Ig domain-containing protein [Leptospira sp.]|nr:putative Ig domain-containing protein [Leptospira sp.]
MTFNSVSGSCEISGTPDIGSSIGALTYTITVGNDRPPGERDETTISINFSVIDPPTGLTINDAGPLIFYLDTAIDEIVFTAIGNNIESCSLVTPGQTSLPNGLGLNRTSDTTCTISGIPGETSVIQTYSVRAENPAGFFDRAVQFEIQGPPTALNYPTLGSPLTSGSPIAPISPVTLGGGTPTNCSVTPALPAGLTINQTTCIISGTINPDIIINPAETYVITASNPAGNTNANVTFAVYPQAPNNLTYLNPATAFTQNISIAEPYVPNTLAGGSPTSCELTATSPATDLPNTLPAGLFINQTTCAIYGTPTVARDSVNYTITASNLGGSTSGNITFSVSPAPPQNLNYVESPYTFTQNVAITPIVPNVDGVITNCIMHASTPLPAGMILDSSNCAISGTPTTTASTASYTVIPSNVSGDGDTASITFSIEPFPAVISVTSPTANGSYKEGVTIPIHVVFNRNVTVTGTGPAQIILNTGTPATTYVDYASGSGTDTLVFSYTIAPGNTSPDLSYVNAASLILNGAFIRDSQSNDASLILPIPGQPNSLSANKNIVVDTTLPQISGEAPLSGASVNSTAVSYTLSETCASGSTTWIRTGGTADPGSPHVANWTGSELNSGSRTDIILGNNPTLVDLATYDISFNCTDPAGNVAVTVTSTNITFNSGPLLVVSAETLDSNSNGKIDTYRISFNKPVNDSTFPGYIPDSLGDITSQWLVAGYTGVRLIHGTAVTFATDTPNDAVIYLRFNENPLDCSADTTVGCDTAAKPDLTTTAIPGLEDLATNTIGQINSGSVVEMDGARPILVGARSLGAGLVNAVFSEPVNLTDSEFVPNYSITPGITILAADRDPVSTNIVRLSTSDQVGGETYTMDVATAVRDLANLNLNTLINPNNSLPANQAIFDGLVKPVVASIVTTSATTLLITFNEPIVASSAECQFQSTCALIYQNISLPVLSAVSEAGAGNNSSTFILTVNPMIQGQAYTTTVLENTVQSVASSERMGNTNNSATFNGDGRPNVNISPDNSIECPANGPQRRVVITYDQTVITGGGANAADNPANYRIPNTSTDVPQGCVNLAEPCSSGTNQTATSVYSYGGNKFGINFPNAFDSDNSQYVLRINNVEDTSGNTVTIPTNLTFQCGNDITPPSLVSISVVGATSTTTVLLLTFSESLSSVEAQTVTNYRIGTTPYGTGISTAALQANTAQVQIVVSPALANGGHQLRTINQRDLADPPNTILDNGLNNVQPFIVNAPTGFAGGPWFEDPFGDGTPAGFIASYDGKLYLGADSTGAKLFEINYGLTQSQTIQLDSDGVPGLPTTGFGSTDNPIDINGVQQATGVDFIYSACLGRDIDKNLSGNDCTSAIGSDGHPGLEYLFIGARNNPGAFDDLFYTTNKSSATTTFTFMNLAGLESAGNTFRLGVMHVFKEYLYIANGDMGSGGPPYASRVCMNVNGCTGGIAFGNVVRLMGRHITRLGKTSVRDNSNSESAQKYANIDSLHEYDADGSNGSGCTGSTNCESQLYMANGGWCTGCNLTVPRTGTTAPTVGDGGIVRTTLHYSTKANPPPQCPNAATCHSENPYSTTNYYDDVTPASHPKWYGYISIPPPTNPAIEWQQMSPVNTPTPSTWAIPYMRTAPNGDLYVLRNACAVTILQEGDTFRDNGRQVCPPGQEVVQLWMMKSCASAASCPPGPNDWVLVAENGTTGQTNMAGNTGKCGSPNKCLENTHLTLLEVVGDHLYIGYDNKVYGANVWRTNMSTVPSGTAPTEASFEMTNEIGLDGSTVNQRIFSHTTINYSGKDWLIVATRDGSAAMKLYRTANDEN